MTGNFLLDTAVLAVSLFNTMLLLWLGIVVLSNADRRSWGIWLASAGLLCSGAFFLIHTAIVGQGLRQATVLLDWLWHLGWVAIIVSPLAWYVVMLWYAGFIEPRSRDNLVLRRIQIPGLIFTVACAGALLGLLLVVGSLPTFTEIVTFGEIAPTSSSGTHLLILIYAVYNIACMALAIHALQHPEPSTRWMGDLARRRARPWLTAASVVLLVVSLLVSAFVVLVYFVYAQELVAQQATVRELLGWLDLVIGGLIAVAVVLIGKATVSYEIFTGKTLPRQGFLRQWRRAVILAAGYSVVVAASITLALPALYVLLLATLVIVAFYALLSVRMFGERERVVRELSPFLASPGERGAESEGLGMGGVERTPFDTLCERVLNVTVAYLCPRVDFAPPLAYPTNLRAPVEAAGSLAKEFAGTERNYVAVAPEIFGGAVWAIPLRDERGLAGVLLLGERKDGGLYAQEEIEIAKAAGERMLHAEASAALTQRLIALQRGRLAETQVVDRRARRVLHDDILPQLHTAMLSLSSGATPEGLQQLSEVHRALSNLLREMPAGVSPQVERYGVLGALHRTVEEEFGGAFDGVGWEVSPEVEERAKGLSALNAEVVYGAAREAVRNAAKHGRGGDRARALHLCVSATWDNTLEIVVEDDGVGSVSHASGNGNGTGQGLALHSTMMAVIGGGMTVERGEGGRGW